MKKDNKKVQYALIGMVALIWGTVAYRIVNWNATGERYAASPIATVSLAEANQLSRDSFVVKVNYRDPFLSTSRRKAKKAVATNNKKSTGKYQRKAPEVKGLNKSKAKPPVLKYLGYSLNESEITRVRISIDGRAYTFKLNEKQEKIRVKEMYKDSVIIRYKGENQTLYRKK